MLAYSFPATSSNREISLIINSTELEADLELVFDMDWSLSVSSSSSRVPSPDFLSTFFNYIN